MQSVSHLALAVEGAVGVNAALLAASVHHCTLVHVYREKTNDRNDKPASAKPYPGSPGAYVAHTQCHHDVPTGIFCLFILLLHSKQSKEN